MKRNRISRRGSSKGSHPCLPYFVTAFAVAIIAIGAFLIFKWPLAHFAQPQAGDGSIAAICTLVATVMATIFGLTLATYTFLQGNLRRLASEDPRRATAIEGFKSKAFQWLSAISVAACLTFVLAVAVVAIVQGVTNGDPLFFTRANGTLNDGWFFVLYCLIPSMGLVTIAEMVYFSSWMLDSDKRLAEMAREIVGPQDANAVECSQDDSTDQKEQKRKEQDWWQDVRIVEMLVNRLRENHEDAIKAFPEKEGLRIVFALRETEDDRLEDNDKSMASCYNKLIERRNAMIILEDFDKSSGNGVSTDDMELRKSVRGTLVNTYLKRENLRAMSFERANLSDASLNDADMTGSNFSFANLSGADCRGAIFNDCYLAGLEIASRGEGRIEAMSSAEGGSPGLPAAFAGAQFKGAVLTDMHLEGGEALEAVRGREAEAGRLFQPNESGEERWRARRYLDWSGTLFDEAKASAARVKQVSFYNASFSNAQLYGSNISDCYFACAGMHKASFVRSTLQDAVFFRVGLTETSFAAATVGKCCFDQSSLESTNFTGAEISACSFDNTYCRMAMFRNALFTGDEPTTFRNAVLVDTDFSNAKLDALELDGCMARNCSLVDCRSMGNLCMANTSFENALYMGAVLERGSFIGIRFDNAAFVDCDFFGSEFVDCDFGQARFSRNSIEAENPDRPPRRFFRSAKLRDVSFRGAYGLSADFFRDATIEGCDFRDTGLTRGEFDREDISYPACIWDDDDNGEEDGDSARSVIERRRSIRAFKTDEVSRDDVERIIEAATFAPSPKNRQPWHFIALDNQDEIARLANEMRFCLESEMKQESCSNDKPSLLGALDTVDVIEQAQVVIFVCYKRDKLEMRRELRSCSDAIEELRASDFEVVDLLSLGAAIENALLDATSIDLGTLWCGDHLYAYDVLREFVGTDEPVVAVLCIGHAAECPYTPRRRPVNEVLEWLDGDNGKERS